MCVCAPGWELSRSGGLSICQKCSHGTFKEIAANIKCSDCALAQSTTLDTGASRVRSPQHSAFLASGLGWEARVVGWGGVQDSGSMCKDPPCPAITSTSPDLTASHSNCRAAPRCRTAPWCLTKGGTLTLTLVPYQRWKHACANGATTWTPPAMAMRRVSPAGLPISFLATRRPTAQLQARVKK